MNDNSSEPERYRLFVAIPIPEEIKRKIGAVQVELREELPERGVAWSKEEQLHLTLKFLGNVGAARVPLLTEQLREACLGFSSLRLRGERVGAFPDLRFPRVLWVGLESEEGKLAELQGAIEAATRGFTAEKPEERFSGHVTLGRAKHLNRRDAQVLSRSLSRLANRSFGQWTADAIELMRSQLSSEGARHTVLARIPFRSLASCPDERNLEEAS